MRRIICGNGADLVSGGQKGSKDPACKTDTAPCPQRCIYVCNNDVQYTHPRRFHRAYGGRGYCGLCPLPSAAGISISTALVIQALLFGDGGITTLGANCFNLAFIMPFTGYYIYQLVSAGSPGYRRRWVALFLAGYVAMNMAAVAVAVELGIQPLIASSPDGRPLYAPYPLSVTMPAMALSHLLFFGFIEAVGTAMVVSYIFKTNETLLHKEETSALRRLWIGLAILIMLTPVGLLAKGTAWGEWATEELTAIFGYAPEGMRRLEGLWTSLLPDYNIPVFNNPWLGSFFLAALVGS